jgi:hypothetical protein
MPVRNETSQVRWLIVPNFALLKLSLVLYLYIPIVSLSPFNWNCSRISHCLSVPFSSKSLRFGSLSMYFVMKVEDYGNGAIAETVKVWEDLR